MSKISNHDLINELRRLANDLDETPSANKMDSLGKHSATTYRKRFGSWNNAVKTAGLSPNTNTNRISSETLINDLIEFADHLGHTPSLSEMKIDGPHAYSTYTTRFGSWNDAVQKAGLEPDTSTSKITEEDLIDEIKRVAKLQEKIPTQQEFDELGEISTSTYYRQFDDWRAVIDKANLTEEYDMPSYFTIKSEDLLNEISRFSSVLGRAPTIAEMNELGSYSERTYRRRFGSWSRSLELAGVDQNGKKDANLIPERELISDLKSVSNELGHSPSFEEMRTHGQYGAATYSYRFGSWNKALEAAELQTRRDSIAKIPNRELILELRRLAGELGHIPQRKEMQEKGGHSGMTYYNRFGSWKQAVAKAGFTTDLSTDETILNARCFACARKIKRPVEKLPNSTAIFCNEKCRNAWENREDLLFEELEEELCYDDWKISNAFTDLSEDEVLTSEVLICLRLAIHTLISSFNSAMTDDYQIATTSEKIIIIKTGNSSHNKLVISKDTVRSICAEICEDLNLLPAAIFKAA